MKKLISLIIAFIFVICEFNVVSVALYDETDCLSVSKFTSAFVEMVSETEDKLNEGVVAENADVYFSSGSTSVENQDVNEEVTDENTEKNYRLIVKSSFELDPLDSVGYVFGYNDLHILQFDNKSSFEKAYDFYDSLQCVEYVEEDLYLTEAAVDDGNDIVYESAIDYPTIIQSNIFGYSTAKSKSNGNNVDIGVVDSGVQHDHEFLNGRVVDTGFNSISDNGTAYDDRGHGTHVAGIIVANTLSDVTVHAYKALNESGSGTAAQVSLAIDAAIEDGMDVINLSVQMKDYSTTLHDAVKRAYNAGVIVVAAAGNAGVDISQVQYSPGCFDEVISVMSCDNSRRILDTSNYGEPCDYAAPGKEILSTYLDNTYKLSTGTSMASPFICAAVAYELAKDDTLSYAQIKAILDEKTQDCYGSPTGKCVYPDVGIAVEDICATPVFALDSCSFAGSLKVSITCESENVDIFYSYDGVSYKEYTGEFYITESSTIYAFARSGLLDKSMVKTVEYTCYSERLDDFAIDENGFIDSFKGENSDVIIPEYVNSQKVNGIASTAFSFNTAIKNVTFKNHLTSVDDLAFMGCSALESVTAKYVTSIGNDSFNGCSLLKRISVNNINQIGERAFMNCSSLTSLNTNSLEKVGTEAFKGCSSLLSFFVNKLTELDISVLSGCNSLENLSIDSVIELPGLGEDGTIAEYLPSLNYVSAYSVKTIPSKYFYGSSLLETVNFGSATTIEDYAFYNSKLKNCTANCVTKIGDYAFANTNIVSVPSSLVEEIGEGAFYNCQSILEVSPYTLTKMGDMAFYNCTSISSVSLPNVTGISAKAFYNNTSLTSVYYSAKCTVIGDEAFMNCINLTDVKCDSKKTNYNYGNRVFYGCSNFATDIAGLYPVSLGSQVFEGTKSTVFQRLSLPTLKNVYACAFDGLQIKSLILPNVVVLEDVPKNAGVYVGDSAKYCDIPSEKNVIIYAKSGSYIINYCITNDINYILYRLSSGIYENAVIYGDPENYQIYFNHLSYGNEFHLYGTNNIDTQPIKVTWLCELNTNGPVFSVGSYVTKYDYLCISVREYTSSTSYSSIYSRPVSFASSEPDVPTTEPDVPTTEPDEPTSEPDVPTIEPDVPTTDPSLPITKWGVKDSDNNTSHEKIYQNGEYVGSFLVSKEKSVEAALANIYVYNGVMSVTPSLIVNGNNIYGTDSLVTIYDNSGNKVDEARIVIYGDINRDGVVDGFDCSAMSNYMYNRDFLENDSCRIAADYNRDETINVIDFQMIVNNSVL